jgi:Lysozyme like domain
MAESGGNPNAVNHNTNGSTDRGLWQINTVHGGAMATSAMFDPMANVRAAISISGNGRNWGPWSTYKNGAYRQFLNASTKPTNMSGVAAAGAAAKFVPGAAPKDTHAGSASAGNTEVSCVIGAAALAQEPGLQTDPQVIIKSEIAALKADYAQRVKDRAVAKKAVELLLVKRAKAVKVLARTTNRKSLAAQKKTIQSLAVAIKKAWLTYDGMDWDVRQVALALKNSGDPTSSVQTTAIATAKADQAEVGGANDPVMQAFDAQITEDTVAGNTAAVAADQTRELAYITGLYNDAVARGDTAQIVALGSLIMSLRQTLGLGVGGLTPTDTGGSGSSSSGSGSVGTANTPQNEITMNIYPSRAPDRIAEPPRIT